MQRHKCLRPLSHDHHHGLVQAHRLQQAGTPDARPLDETVAGFIRFWEEDGQRHFRDEEEILLPAYHRRADPDRPEIVEMLLQHIAIRRHALELSEDLAAGRSPAPQALRALGELLERHIRLEERVVFPLIEQALTDAEWAWIAARWPAARDT
ncbi:MAG TPA: hemerythrin domain-containing protein [Limnochordia bacterium]